MLGKRSAQWGLFEADTPYADFVGSEPSTGIWRRNAVSCFAMKTLPSCTVRTSDGLSGRGPS